VICLSPLLLEEPFFLAAPSALERRAEEAAPGGALAASFGSQKCHLMVVSAGTSWADGGVPL
jgi:hypothetical protein